MNLRNCQAPLVFIFICLSATIIGYIINQPVGIMVSFLALIGLGWWYFAAEYSVVLAEDHFVWYLLNKPHSIYYREIKQVQLKKKTVGLFSKVYILKVWTTEVKTPDSYAQIVFVQKKQMIKALRYLCKTEGDWVKKLSFEIRDELSSKLSSEILKR